MTRYDYKVIPAPSRGVKAPGVKAADARFALGLEQAINALAAEGWEYQRADILPSSERRGLISTTTVYRTVLVFRRPRAEPPAAGTKPDALAVARDAEAPDRPAADAPALRRAPTLTARRREEAPPPAGPLLAVVATRAADASEAPAGRQAAGGTADETAEAGASPPEAARSGDEDPGRG